MRTNYLFFLLFILMICSCSVSPKRKTYNCTSGAPKNSQISSNQNNKSGVKTSHGPKKWRQNLPGGGYADYVQNKDGTLTVTQVQPCMFCHGTKVCPGCGGTGGTYGRAYGGMYYPCKMCLQSGKCNSCKGEGQVTTISRTDAAGNTSIVSSNGYSAVGGPAGAIVTDPNGRRTGHPSGGGFNSESSSSSSKRDNKNDYVEIIQYAPNYTGEPNDAWCGKCQSYSPRHVHIKKRVY